MSLIHRLHNRWYEIHPLGRFTLGAAAVGAVALALVPPAMKVARGWGNDRRATEAAEALAGGRPAQARELARSVLQQDHSRKELIPILLKASDDLRDPRRTEIAFHVLVDPAYNPGERHSAWLVACQSSPCWLLQAAWTLLTDDERAQPGFGAPLIDRLLRERMLADAANVLELMKDSKNSVIELRQLRLQLATKTAEAHRAMVEALVAKLGTLTATEEMMALIDELPQASIDATLFSALSIWQAAKGTPSPEAELRMARCHMVAIPEQREEIYQAALTRYQDESPLATARWCLQIGRHDDCIRILENRPELRDNQDAFRVRCEAYDAAERYDDLARILSAPPVEVSVAWAACEAARVAGLRGQAKARDSASDQAFKAAAESPQDSALIDLARQADEAGLATLAQRTWVEAIRRRNGPLPVSVSIRHIIEKLANSGKEPELFDVLSAYRLLEPGNPVITVQHDYLACLNGHLPPDKMIQNITPIVEMMPDPLPVSCVLALGNLLTGHPKKAEELTEGDVDWFSSTPANRAIRGLALQANGRGREAEPLFVDFPWDSLLPSERKVYRSMWEANVKP